MAEYLKVACAEFSTLSQAVSVTSVIAWHRQVRPLLMFKTQSRSQCCITFYVRNLWMLLLRQSVCPRQGFLAQSIVCGLHKSVASKRCFIRVIFSGTHKHQTRLEKIADDKHSNLLSLLVNYKRTHCNTLGPWFHLVSSSLSLIYFKKMSLQNVPNSCFA